MKTDEEIEEEAVKAARKVWSGQFLLPYVHCNLCHPADPKQRCVCDIMTGNSLCAKHWIERKIKELQEQNKPQLDVDYFAKI